MILTLQNLEFRLAAGGSQPAPGYPARGWLVC
jgi:hypothetical protein